MNAKTLARALALTMLTIGFLVPEGIGQSIGGLFEMVGGMDTVKKLSTNLLRSSASDPRLAGVLGNVDASAVAPKLADQMCSMLGGGCKAPLTDDQIAAGASKLDATQTTALGDNFSSALKDVTGNPLVKKA